MMHHAPYLQWIDQQQAEMSNLLMAWASLNTGSFNLPGLAGFIELIRPLLLRLTPLDGMVREIPLPPMSIISNDYRTEQRPLGKALALRSPTHPGSRVLLAIHMDTVFGPEHAFQAVTRVDANTLRGPGVCDAKGGLLVMLFALLALQRSPYAGRLNWEILLNPDEELGSPGSGPLFTEAARRNDVALLFEPALPDGALVSARKGSGNFTFLVRGRSAHAGRDSHLGRNAIHALAGLVARLAALQEEIPGIIINTGFIQGGGPVNIVPDRALCRVNVRLDDANQLKVFENGLKKVLAASVRDGIEIETHGGFHCPPKVLTPALQSTLESFKECAQQLGHALDWRPTGGACDGNRTAAAGVPTVDSLGPRGGGMHTDQEFVLLDSLVECARLVALFLMRLAAGEISIGSSTTTPRAEAISS